MLKVLLAALKAATNLPLSPFDTTNTNNCITYRWIPLMDDGAVCKYRLELRVITQTLEDGESYKAIVKETLLPVGDEEKIIGMKGCILNGGGSLKDYSTNTVHTLLYFEITMRSEN